MRIHRIHTTQGLEPDSEIILRDGPAHYLSRVLRVTCGQSIVLFNGDGHDYVAEITHVAKNQASIAVLSRLPARPESPFRITVVQAISRGDRMDQTLQKSTELGAAAFQPLISDRVEFRLKADKLEKRMVHWRNVLISACEQCGRATIPSLAQPVSLPEWLDVDDDTPRLVLEPGATLTLAQVRLENMVELLLGPEGGFAESERALIRNHRIQAVSLGPRILRTETAGPAAVAILQMLAGDFA